MYEDRLAPRGEGRRLIPLLTRGKKEKPLPGAERKKKKRDGKASDLGGIILSSASSTCTQNRAQSRVKGGKKGPGCRFREKKTLLERESIKPYVTSYVTADGHPRKNIGKSEETRVGKESLGKKIRKFPPHLLSDRKRGSREEKYSGDPPLPNLPPKES